MTKEQKESRSKVEEFARKLVLSNGNGPLVLDRIVNYAQTVGYDILFADELQLSGLRNWVNRLVNKLTCLYADSSQREGPPMSATKADRADVRATGGDVKEGDPVHKDPWECSIDQLGEMIKATFKHGQRWLERGSKLVEIYRLRTSQQYELPFRIPAEIQKRMKAQAEEELRLRRVAGQAV
jgi:hypothetical protein